jgi:hypothetical protein
MDSMQRVMAVRNISNDLLASLPRFVRGEDFRVAYDHSAISPKTCVIRAHSAGLHPQYEAGELVVGDLERLASRLREFACEQRCSDEGLHGECPPDRV